MSPKKKLALALVCASIVCFLGCTSPKETPEPPAATAPVAQLDQSNKGLTDADLPALYTQTQLTTLDLRGNDLSADAVTALIAALPNCEVIWSIPLGSARFDSTSTELTLPADTTAKELSRLSLFPALAKVDAGTIQDYEALKAAAAALPNCEISWTS